MLSRIFAPAVTIWPPAIWASITSDWPRMLPTMISALLWNGRRCARVGDHRRGIAANVLQPAVKMEAYRAPAFAASTAWSSVKMQVQLTAMPRLARG